MANNINKKKVSNFVFYLFMLLGIIPLFFHKFYISSDGPQHLYNANVLLELFNGNDTIREFFKINPVIVGYWSGHFFLAFFKFFLPAWLAEKFFIICYIVVIAFSFRYLINSINKGNNYLSILIFPFAYSMYFMMGYYSFSIAFIPFFLIFGYIIRCPKLNAKNIIILGLLFLFSFLSHAFIFALTCISVALYIGIDFLFKKIRKEEARFKDIIIQSSLVGIAALPAIILWIVYIKYVMVIDNTIIPDNYSFKELTYFLLRIRHLVAFHHDIESVGNITIFSVLVILFISLVIQISKIKKEERFKAIFKTQNVWFIIAFFFLGLYYLMPDRISAGSLTNRVGLIFFYVLIIAFAMQKFQRIIIYISTILLFFSFLYLQNFRTRKHIHLNEIVQDIHSAEKQIENNSILYTLRFSDYWFDRHFGCYLGVDKPIINLKSPQNNGQFPVVWNFEQLPIIKMGNKRVFENNPLHMPQTKNTLIDSVDYILIYHKHKDYELGENYENILREFYQLIYTSPKGYADLYHLK